MQIETTFPLLKLQSALLKTSLQFALTPEEKFRSLLLVFIDKMNQNLYLDISLSFVVCFKKGEKQSIKVVNRVWCEKI